MTSHLFADPQFPSDPKLLLQAETGPACEIGKAQIASLRSLGHKLERFLHARGLVHRRIFQDDTFAALRPWFGKKESGPSSLTEEGTFVSMLWQSEHGLRLGAAMLPQELASNCLTLWRQTDPEAPKVLSPLLQPLLDAAAPLWLALLRLRPLRLFWESVLRRDHLETLLHICPDAWLLDPTPLPPGAVIPRLELSRWEDLPRKQHDEDHPFAISSPASMEGARELNEDAPAEAWADALGVALRESTTELRILVELPHAPEAWLLAFYEKKGSRVDARGFLSLRRSEDGGWQAAKVR